MVSGSLVRSLGSLLKQSSVACLRPYLLHPSHKYTAVIAAMPAQQSAVTVFSFPPSSVEAVVSEVLTLFRD